MKKLDKLLISFVSTILFIVVVMVITLALGHALKFMCEHPGGTFTALAIVGGFATIWWMVHDAMYGGWR